MSTVRQWFEVCMAQQMPNLIGEALKIWPNLFVREKGSPSDHKTLLKKVFKLNKEIKKQSGLKDYYPMVVPIADHLVFFFSNQAELEAAQNFLKTNEEFGID